ncbi:hypothetical protein HPB51_017939 [Rhipicephalus microplus]|uniref:Uncharacterized protein n=1 Tax=Rhipicephalus microplus TaxID=6941 RepID=A0A9J6EQ03_RHIMP|nr:hypothetical protein HPB51_017939 [Rhipicephalus microplus]
MKRPARRTRSCEKKKKKTEEKDGPPSPKYAVTGFSVGRGQLRKRSRPLGDRATSPCLCGGRKEYGGGDDGTGDTGEVRGRGGGKRPGNRHRRSAVARFAIPGRSMKSLRRCYAAPCYCCEWDGLLPCGLLPPPHLFLYVRAKAALIGGSSRLLDAPFPQPTYTSPVAGHTGVPAQSMSEEGSGQPQPVMVRWFPERRRRHRGQ